MISHGSHSVYGDTHPSHSDTRPLSFQRFFLASFFIFLIICTSNITPWSVFQATPVRAAGTGNPKIPSPPWLQAPGPAHPKDLGKYVTSHPSTKIIPIPHVPHVTMKPVTLAMTAQSQLFLSTDHTLEIDIPADTVSATQMQTAGGSVHLKVVQLDAGSGGGSGQIILGSYQLLLQDASGKPLTTLVLAHPLTITYHLQPYQQPLLLRGQTVYALWDGSQSASTSTGNKSVPGQGGQQPLSLQTSVDPAGTSWSVSTSLSTTVSTHAHAQTALPALANSAVTFGTAAPQASWGTPTDFQVGLNAGGLSYNYPLDLPPGPGGFTPPLSLNYNSGSVNESHNVQAAATWVGEGWSLGLGSITWSTRDVTPGGTNRIENIWTITDPSGISGQLIPPDLNAATSFPASPAMGSLPAQYLWHSAPESHAKVQEVNFNGGPCWHVWLPNGTMEEFGCTDPSRQGSQDAGGHWNSYRWDLDLMVDRYGNQIRINYQRYFPPKIVRDVAISSIEYDDPGCHNTTFNGATAQCATWNPKVRLVFDSSTKVTTLSNPTGGCQNWSTTATYRCDDPVDNSGSGGLPIPGAINIYVLNDIHVLVNGNPLHTYLFSYEQIPPYNITEPVLGLQESIAGYLDLTQIQEQGTNNTTLNAPVVNISYQTGTQHYEDLQMRPKPATNCGFGWARRDGTGCFLWSQSYNSRYIQTLDNGRGWHETISWAEARSNVHGVDTGAVNDVFNCDGHELSSNLCGEADDEAWGRIVVGQRTAVTNGVTSTWTYHYYLRTNWPAPPCANCLQGDTWANQNDGDFADYYNATFTGFDSAQVINPDNTNDIAFFASSDGWGLAESSFQCYVTGGHCNTAPYWNPNPGMSGHLLMEQNWSAASKLVSVSKNTYAMNCPPPGVAHSNNTNTGLDNPGSTQLSSELDQNNPVVVCDPRVTQSDHYQVDGVTDMYGYLTDARVLHQQTNYTYDGDNQGPNRTAGYDYGNVSKVDTTGNVDMTGNHAATSHTVTTSTYYPNDNLGSGIYLTNLPAQQQTQDSTGTVLACSQNVYGANANATTPPTIPGVTQSLAYTMGGGCTGSTVTVKHGYDASGNPVGNIDGDNHLGCTIGSTQYSACAIYDSFGSHLISTANAKNQITSSTYDSSAAGGFGQWVTAITDANGQTTSFQYDVLGRLTATIRPGDSTNSPTIITTYSNTCTNGSTAPCLELDTSTRTTTGGPTTTTRQWYDGEGHVVETRSPSPSSGSDLITYTLYDTMGRPTTKSLTYSVPTSSGYIAPDLTKARSVTGYDAAGRPLGQVTYSDQNNGTFIVLSTSISYTVAQGVTGLSSENNNAYEQTITLDAYNHQSISYSDALGRSRYTQIFSGTNPYSVVRTVGTNYDGQGNVILVQTFDHTATVQASQSASFDALKRRTGMNDSDLGSCQNTPLPAGCSSSNDWAWKSSYDADGNLLSQGDPRNQQVYTSYDILDRPLCRGTASTDVNPCQNSAYASYFYDSYTNSSNPGVTFPTGCIAPSGSYASDPISHQIAETFRSAGAGSGWRCGGFDQRGQLDQSSLSVTTASQTTMQTMHMVYNDMGQVTQLVYPDGQTVTSQYDTDGRFRIAYLGAPTSPDPVNFLVGQTNYTGFGALYSLAIGGSGPKSGTPTPIFTSAFGYDGIQRPWESSATRQGSSQPFWDQVRSYDNVGNVLGVNTTVPTSSGGTQSEQQAFCYDALNRVVWAGNTGTSTGGDHCMWSAPGSTPLPTYTQQFNYDDLDRLTTGPAGILSYGNVSHVHAATNLSTIPNPYAAYDPMGNMTCRNVDPTSGHTCGTTPTGAQMTYDAEGRLASWTAPSGTTSSINYLYDNEGNRVLQHQSTTTGGTTTTTDTVTFDSYTETVITGGTTLTTQFYTVAGRQVAMKQGNALYYLLGDLLGSISVVLKDDGTFQAAQLFAPYGTTRYTQGTMPTTYNFTGQRLDSQTGLLYYNSRYYDPVVGRFARADTVQDNGQGMDPYAYVGENPETRTDPTGQRYISPDGSTTASINLDPTNKSVAIISFFYGGQASYLHTKTNFFRIYQKSRAYRAGPDLTHWVRKQTGVGKQPLAPEDIAATDRAIEYLGQLGKKINYVSNVLLGVGAIIDGVTSGQDYYQHHRDQGIGAAVGVGIGHAVLSTLGVLIGAEAGEVIGTGLGVLVGGWFGPGGAIVGGLIGATVLGAGFGWWGGMAGDQVADDWAPAEAAIGHWVGSWFS